MMINDVETSYHVPVSHLYVFLGEKVHSGLLPIFKSRCFFCFFFYWRIMLYNIVVVSAIHQCKSVMIILYICSLLSHPPLLIPALSVVTEHAAGLPVLHSSFPLAVCFRHNGAYVSMLLSQLVPPSPSPTVSTRPFSLSPFLLCK